jgi:hypothetical protein
LFYCRFPIWIEPQLDTTSRFSNPAKSIIHSLLIDFPIQIPILQCQML